MQVNVAGLRRNIKNLAHNYSDAQVKVREATSNDPWGPSSTLMSEIADLTYNVVAFTEIMQMIWKRLNDHGRNWRHVYKALVLLEYLIKTGTEKVAQQCKENIFAIQTLKDFQYFEDNKDQGMSVRGKAKQLVELLKDDERLRNERARALKAKERFAQAASGFGSDGMEAVSPSSPSFPAFKGQWTTCEAEASSRGGPSSSELETARPQTVGEEELQLQLALAMSREEAEQEEQRRRSDDVRLQLALSQSEEEFKHQQPAQQSHMLDLLDVNLGAPAAPVDPWGFPQAPVSQSSPVPTRPQTLDIFHYSWESNDPWSSPASHQSVSAAASPSPSPAVDPWTPVSADTVNKPSAAVDPWSAVSPHQIGSSTGAVPRQVASGMAVGAVAGGAAAASVATATTVQDPWSPATNTEHSSPSSTAGDLDEFDIITNRASASTNANMINNNGGTLSPDPFDLTGLGDSLSENRQTTAKKTPQSFLGENSSLVNLDNLVTMNTKPAAAAPPPVSSASLATANPFSGVPPQPQAGLYPQSTSPALRPVINQSHQPAASPWGAPTVLQSPLVPSAQPNPFLS
ncbi:epsin-2 isoform X1 [Schistocerca serialis cubense]|uniref:epsin-2 isoform X1 n=1 Tax=Schistocerca serialis cubense TaxID=2023355 RepID=UPI00214E2AAD|nr:epsin-2 isoform X1 [Schistocerca serialis cubense]XP_049950360.1 epsin-2 isoform X1 [Schistocerca serialis cubense]XP_049950361.1 epsin-2 isoform X1 [Schistocerca serialis cubense]XP_049950362.1 epsin-2 isoform X1 [Schistocerca serialis cubense]